MKNIVYKGRKSLADREGAVSTEQMILIFIALTIATALSLYRCTAKLHIQRATNRLGDNDFDL